MKPVIALVGRPNVGKSTLFNRLTRSRDALVADLPGLTRDRHYGEGRIGERPFLVIDTGGFEPVAKEGIMFEMALQTRQAVAEAQARALGKAFESADIDIIGGDGQFFDRIMNAVSYGKAVDGFVQGSDAAQGMLSEYAKGHRSLPADLKDVLTRPALGSGDIQNLTISALLAKLMAGADGEKRGKLDKLIDTARELGL